MHIIYMLSFFKQVGVCFSLQGQIAKGNRCCLYFSILVFRVSEGHRPRKMGLDALKKQKMIKDDMKISTCRHIDAILSHLIHVDSPALNIVSFMLHAGDLQRP